ncbi:acyl carrier protein, partial [Bacillus atrophaeus]|uniref:acyl carrier protein n=1 Tax=Bacillus atrophaeus TaxID=1452 RepID=UPI00227DB093
PRGVNYDGKTNGITAPNPFSQTELIESIYDKFQINPLDIQYVMAHSTGSNIGDPLEVQALTRAFNKYTKQKQFCAIGSIKSLIGHTFAASGVVSLISMLMAMNDQTIPATHHCETSNSYIQFNESPFVLHKENQAWKKKNGMPRVGTISTTGISGTNAHAVVEEYDVTRSHSTECPQVIVLSAQNEERLQAVARKMLEYAERNEFTLPDFAYTLQVGREAMEARLAMVVNNKEELVRKLKEYDEAVKNGESFETFASLFTGNAEENQELQDETVLQVFVKENNLQKIAQYWTKGNDMSWELLHNGNEVRTIPLPGYPFERERYWVSAGKKEQDRPKAIKQSIEENETIQVLEDQSSQEKMQECIVQFLSRELNLTRHQISFKRKFLDYGLDSILGRKLMRHIEKNVHIKITGRDILEFQTVQSLAAHLALKADGQNQPIKVPSTKKTSSYTDEQIIGMMKEVAQGKLDFKSVQTIIEGSK